jgi:hypothetical protein
MKIQRVLVNQRKAQLELVTRSGKSFPFPFAKLKPRPSSKDRLVKAFVDDELGNEAVTYSLASGREGSVHIDHALEYNQEPK